MKSNYVLKNNGAEIGKAYATDKLIQISIVGEETISLANVYPTGKTEAELIQGKLEELNIQCDSVESYSL